MRFPSTILLTAFLIILLIALLLGLSKKEKVIRIQRSIFFLLLAVAVGWILFFVWSLPESVRFFSFSFALFLIVLGPIALSILGVLLLALMGIHSMKNKTHQQWYGAKIKKTMVIVLLLGSFAGAGSMLRNVNNQAERLTLAYDRAMRDFIPELAKSNKVVMHWTPMSHQDKSFLIFVYASEACSKKFMGSAFIGSPPFVTLADFPSGQWVYSLSEVGKIQSQSITFVLLPSKDIPKVPATYGTGESIWSWSINGVDELSLMKYTAKNQKVSSCPFEATVLL